MTDSIADTETPGEDEQMEALTQRPDNVGRKGSKSLSMHDGIAVWCDCCSCEAEPYWVEMAEQLGIDVGSDYEDSDTDCT